MASLSIYLITLHAPKRLGQSYYTKLNNMKLSRNGQTKLKFLLLYYLPLCAYSSPEWERGESDKRDADCRLGVRRRRPFPPHCQWLHYSIIPTVWPLSPYIINSYHTPSHGPRANHWIRDWRWGSFVERLLQIAILTSGEQFTSHPSDASRASRAHCILNLDILFKVIVLFKLRLVICDDLRCILSQNKVGFYILSKDLRVVT